MSDIVIEEDLRELFGSPRDQGPRPTCLAFAVSDTHAAIRAAWDPLSCEYLYFHAIQRDGTDPGSGATTTAMLAAIENDGQPIEIGWPYLIKSPANGRTWRPPADVGQVFRRPGEVVGTSFEDAWLLIKAGRPAVVVMSISDAFYLPQNGTVEASEPVDPTRRHAVVAVATGRSTTSRLLMVRNSWGSLWGATGHVWLTEPYLAPRVMKVVALKEAI